MEIYCARSQFLQLRLCLRRLGAKINVQRPSLVTFLVLQEVCRALLHNLIAKSSVSCYVSYTTPSFSRPFTSFIISRNSSSYFTWAKPLLRSLPLTLSPQASPLPQIPTLPPRIVNSTHLSFHITHTSNSRSTHLPPHLLPTSPPHDTFKSSVKFLLSPPSPAYICS